MILELREEKQVNFVKLTEVGPRDGLQNEKRNIDLSDKLEFLRLLRMAGFQSIEATSFVRKDKIPQLADSEELSAILQPKSYPMDFIALVPNEKGYERAVDSGYGTIAIFTATSESFSEKNTNRSVKKSLEELKSLCKKAQKDGVKVRGYISTVIHCPYEGYQKPEATLEIASQLLEFGCYEISLGETIGKAVPRETEALLSLLFSKISPSLFAGHFHDTYGQAIANVSRSLQMGLRSFDSSSGGLGGCPYAKGASGNVATEDLLYFLEKEGFETGVRLSDVYLASQFIEGKLLKQLPSKVYQAWKNADSNS